MECIQVLKQEHEVIERVLVLLDQAVSRWERGAAVPDGFANWSVRFFRQFADQCHHFKEEEALFPLLERHGIPREGGPVGVMLHEHVLGRELVGQMDRAATGQVVDAAEFSRAASQYAVLLRQHIWKENNVLFAMAERVLTADEDRSLIRQYDAATCELDRQAAKQRMVAEVEQWEKAF